VELFEEIRREYEFGIGTVQGVARKFGVHRRLVREALGTALPPEKPPNPRPRPRIGPVAEVIDAMRLADRQAPRKQRHTAHRISHRIWARLAKEHPEHPVAGPTVRWYVRERKKALGLLARETFVPQSYPGGSEAQVDWYEAACDRNGERSTLQVFSLRSMASRAAFHRADFRVTQQAFLEAHQLAFHYFGGVFHRLRYDNLGSAVQKILRGHRREETVRFVAIRSHWRFAAEFCNPAEGHEKGGVEGEVGYFRRNHWVPVPKARDLAELNEQLLAACWEDEGRIISGRTETVGAALRIEQPTLHLLAEDDFDLSEVRFPMVSTMGWIRVRTNAYSVPQDAGIHVEAKLAATSLEIWHGGKCIAVHERSHRRYQEILDLEHDLEVLEHKPGAFAGSKSLAQWRASGRWPASYDQLWESLMERQGRSAGTKAMIGLLQLGKTDGYDRLRVAIETALALGCSDSAAVQHLLTTSNLRREQPVEV
jgi:transposase